MVTGACRQDDNVSGQDRDVAPVFTPETQHGAPTRYAEDLVRRRMKMVERIDAVSPRIGPFMAGADLLVDLRVCICFERAPLQDDGSGLFGTMPSLDR